MHSQKCFFSFNKKISGLKEKIRLLYIAMTTFEVISPGFRRVFGRGVGLFEINFRWSEVQFVQHTKSHKLCKNNSIQFDNHRMVRWLCLQRKLTRHPQRWYCFSNWCKISLCITFGSKPTAQSVFRSLKIHKMLDSVILMVFYRCQWGQFLAALGTLRHLHLWWFWNLEKK